MEQPPRPAHVGMAVVNYHSAPDVAGLLASLPRGDDVRLSVVVVDNSTSAEELARCTVAAREASGLAVEVVDAGANLGYAGGNNRAVAHLLALDDPPGVLVVVNPDVRWVAGSLAELAAYCLAHDDAIVSVPTRQDGQMGTGIVRYLPLTGYFRPDAAGSTHRFAYAAGHCFALTADRWRALGGLTEAYFLYCEEIDLALRHRAAQGRLATFDAGAVEHEGGGAINGEASGRSLTSYFHGTRSRVLLHRRFPSLWPSLAPLVVLRTGWAVSLLLTGRVAEGRAVLRALAAGLRDPRPRR